MEGSRYFAANADSDEEGKRLRLIERGTDSETFRRLTRLGVEPGWQCLEVGAGAGSVAAWLAERVGRDGHVVALDIETRHLQWLAASNVTVRQHNVEADELETDRYDLAHCRALLEHLTDPSHAVRRMADALRGGGWIVVEGGDFGHYACTDADHPFRSVFDSVMARIVTYVKEAEIFDPTIATTLPTLLHDAGLDAVEYEAIDIPTAGGEPMSLMFEMSWTRFDSLLIARGIITEEEATLRHEAHLDPTFVFTYGNVGCWGQRTADNAS